MRKNKIIICAGVISMGLLATGCGSMINAADPNGSGADAGKTAAVDGTMNEGGTSETDQPKTEVPPDTETNESEGNKDESRTTVSLRIVDGAEDKTLILAGKGSHDVYALPIEGIPIYLDGKLADAGALEDGMMADISYDGSVLDTFPAKLGDVDGIYVYSRGSEKNPYGSTYDICGLYLKVLEDLWKEDEGLNGGSKYISVDLSEAPGNLTESEKNAIAWIFAGRHNMEMLTLPYDELVKQGYIKDMCWEDGLLFSITGKKGDKKASLPTIEFDASKWRSGTGAYMFNDCRAVWPEKGTWEDYSIGGFAIS